jgi:hypothetical protein
LFEPVGLFLPVEAGMLDKTGVPDPVQVAFIWTAPGVIQEPDVNTVVALGLFGGV